MEKIKLLTDYKLCKDTETALDTLKNIDSSEIMVLTLKLRQNYSSLYAKSLQIMHFLFLNDQT